VILAKGERLVAGLIRDAAREAGVPLWTDAALVQALRAVEPGDEIPESAFEPWHSCWLGRWTSRSWRC